MPYVNHDLGDLINNYVVILRNTDSSKEVVWFDNYEEAKAFSASVNNALQIIPTPNSKVY